MLNFNTLLENIITAKHKEFIRLMTNWLFSHPCYSGFGHLEFRLHPLLAKRESIQVWNF